MNQDPTGQSSGQASMTPNKSAVNPVLLWVFIIVLLGAGGYFAWFYLGQNSTEVSVPVASPSVTATKSAAPKPTVSASASASASATASPTASVTASPSAATTVVQ